MNNLLTYLDSDRFAEILNHYGVIILYLAGIAWAISLQIGRRKKRDSDYTPELLKKIENGRKA